MSLTWEQAHNISIVRYLSMHGEFPVYSSCGGREYHYHSPIRSTDSTPSFHANVEKNKWHDKGLGLGGDSIDLVAHHKNMTRSQACHWLSQSGLYDGDYIPEYPDVQKGKYWSDMHKNNSRKPTNFNKKYAKLESDTSFIIQSIQNLQHPMLLDYLRYRCIDKDIASRHGLQEINYQIFTIPESEFFSLAWMNDSGGCEFNNKQSNGKSFKGCLGIKDISSINLQADKKLAVFESAIDFWSYLTYYNIQNFENSAIILNTISLRNKVLDIATQYQPNCIYLFLDNDIEGCKTTESLIADIRNIPVHDKSNLYEAHKDFNEWHIEQMKQKT